MDYSASDSPNVKPFDTYRHAFLCFLAQGMGYDEAMAQFDEREFSRLAIEELEIKDAVIDPTLMELVTNDERKEPALFELYSRAQFEKRNNVDSPDFQQAMDLWAAGWKSELPRTPGENFWSQVQVMSYYWRRPSKRKGSKGRLFLSTNQAWQALRREREQ